MPGTEPILNFGIFKGATLSGVPRWYLSLIADDSFGDSKRAPRKEKKFRVPEALMLAARKLLKARGYRKIGTRWELL